MFKSRWEFSEDKPRKSMEANEYKEYIFGLLFLKRMSDVFEEKHEVLRKEYKHLPKEVQETLLEDRTTYGETFFIPKRARWNERWYDAENNPDYRLMIEEFNNFPPLLKGNFEFPDLLGAAYEFILKYFTSSTTYKKWATYDV